MKSEYINCKNCKDDCRCRGKNITPICVSFTPAKITNADRIRSMSDEELATYLNNMQGLAYINGFDSEPIRFYPNNYGAWLDWLRQETQT